MPNLLENCASKGHGPIFLRRYPPIIFSGDEEMPPCICWTLQALGLQLGGGIAPRFATRLDAAHLEASVVVSQLLLRCLHAFVHVQQVRTVVLRLDELKTSSGRKIGP